MVAPSELRPARGRRRVTGGRRFLFAGLLLVTLGVAREAARRRRSPAAAAPRPASAFPAHLYHRPAAAPDGAPCRPRRLHLAPRSDPRQHGDGGPAQVVDLTVSFLLAPTCPADRVAPVVAYGRAGGAMEGAAVAGPEDRRRFNYTSNRSGGVYWSDWIYHVALPDLAVGREEYWYQVLVVSAAAAAPEEEMGNDDNGPPRLSTMGGMTLSAVQRMLRRGRRRDARPRILAATRRYTFHTPPLPHAPTHLALVGDLGQTENSTRTMYRIWRGTSERRHRSSDHVPISQLLIAGDMAYADAEPGRWTSWFDLMEPLLRSTPLSVAVGNHEIECDTATGRPFVPYEHYFHNPNRLREAHIEPISDDYRRTLPHGSCATPSELLGTYDYGNAFYSFRHGLAHIIVLNSYSDSSRGSAQYAWLRRELRHRFDRRATPWLLVAFHCPLHTTFRGHVREAQALRMRRALAPLFDRHGVNLVVSGHDHGYLRTLPLTHRGAVDPAGRAPVYWTLGAGGNRERHAPGFRRATAEPWAAARSLADYGFGSLLLRNATHARLAWVRDGAEEDGGGGGFQDRVWLENKHYVAVE